MCQCPLGLIPHFYDFYDEYGLQVKGKRVNALSGLYLISTWKAFTARVMLWHVCQCPLGLIPHFYAAAEKYGTVVNVPVSMPSRAYTSFLRYPFKNLGFMRFPEPVFAGIYQNILTTAVFRAC